MEKYKKHVRISNRLSDAIAGLKYQNLKQIQAKIEEFNNKCSDATKDSHSFNTSIDKHWYTAADIAAGFMLAQFTKYLRLLPVDRDIQVNLLASEINVE